MSEIFHKWLNHDVILSRKVTAFEHDFANGYLFGELLQRHGFLSDFDETFVDDGSYSAKESNFGKLKAALEGPAKVLRIKLRDEQISEIMNADRGSSLRLLFQLRKSLLQTGEGATRAHSSSATARFNRAQPRFNTARLPELHRAGSGRAAAVGPRATNAAGADARDSLSTGRRPRELGHAPRLGTGSAWLGARGMGEARGSRDRARAGADEAWGVSMQERVTASLYGAFELSEAGKPVKKVRKSRKGAERKDREGRRHHRMQVESHDMPSIIDKQKFDEARRASDEHVRFQQSKQPAAKAQEEEEREANPAPGVGDSKERMDETSSSDEDDVGYHSARKSPRIPVPPAPVADIAAMNPEVAAEAAADVLVECVRDQLVAAYLFRRGQWRHHGLEGADEALASTQRTAPDAQITELPPQPDPLDSAAPSNLGELVRWLCTPEPSPLGEAQLPAEFLPVIAIGGSPAGLDGGTGTATLVARRLCTEFELALLEPDKVVDECIALANKEEIPEWPPLARLQEIGRSLLEQRTACGGAGAIPHGAYVEMLFRKIELLASPPPPRPDEEEAESAPAPKKKAAPKGKGKKEEEKKEVLKPKGVVIVGWSVDLAQYSAWESSLRNFTSPLLRILDGEADRLLQLSSVLAPWWADGAEAELRGVAEPAMLPAEQDTPAYFLRLCHPDQTALRDAAVKGFSEEGSGPGAGSEDAALHGLRCPGYAQELAAADSPVDRAWLSEAAQVLVRAAATPLGTYRSIIAGTPTADLPEEACYREVQALVATWRRMPDAAADVAHPAEFVADGGDVDDASQASQVSQGDHTESGEEHRWSAPWTTLDADSRARMKRAWLEFLAGYLTGLRTALRKIHEKSASFGADLVNVQQNFLTLLQQADDKHKVLDEFLRVQQQRLAGRGLDDSAERLEELSDRLWQFADRRRADAVEERHSLMTCGFWEQHAAAVLRFAERLQGLEHKRFLVSAVLLVEAHGKAPLAPCELSMQSIVPELISTPQQLTGWLRSSTAYFAEAGSGVVETFLHVEELGSALMTEQAGFLMRLQAVEIWAASMLEGMHAQVEEVWSRLDDWIRDRVRVEDNAIMNTVAQLRRDGCKPPAGKKSILPAVRQTIFTALEPSLLNASLLLPPTPEMPGPLDAPHDAAGGDHRWTLAMLQGLAESLVSRSRGAGSMRAEKVLGVLLELRNKTYSFESELLPTSWVQRSEAAYELLCQSFVAPAWGAPVVDLTELLLAITFHTQSLPWPSLEALEATRQLLESERFSLCAYPEKQRAYPDVPIPEDVFLSLPLWGGRGEDVHRWLFRVLLCFEKESQPRVPLLQGPRQGDPDENAVSARRLLTYMCLGDTPAAGLRRKLRLLLPRPLGRDADVAPTEPPAEAQIISVLEIYRVLVSYEGRPADLVPPAPEYESFLKELQPELYDENFVPEPPAGGKKGADKAKKKFGTAQKEPPPPPEEATTAMSEREFLRHPAVLRTLCNQGGLLCRRRVLAELFPEGHAGQTLATAAEAAAARPLSSLVPAAPAGEEAGLEAGAVVPGQ